MMVILLCVAKMTKRGCGKLGLRMVMDRIMEKRLLLRQRRRLGRVWMN